jgi:hypothetical protein
MLQRIEHATHNNLHLIKDDKSQHAFCMSFDQAST